MEQELVAEIEMIRQAQRGDHDAYGQLYQRHFDAITQYIARRLDGSCDSEDLTQTVFLKAWQGLRDYQPASTPFRAWLFRIAHNTVVDHYRASKTRRKQVAPQLWDDLTLAADPQHGPEMAAFDGEQRATLQQAVANLRPSYQQVIEHRFWQEKDYSEAAADLGLQVNNLRVLQHRALDALRRALTQEIALGLALVCSMLIFGRQLVVSTTSAQPGERFYSLRLATEQARVLLSDEAAKLQLHSQFADQRLAELRQLIAQGQYDLLASVVQNWITQIDAAAQLASRNPTDGQLHAQMDELIARQTQALTDLLARDPQRLQSVLDPAFAALTAAQAAQQPATIPTPIMIPTRALTDAPTAVSTPSAAINLLPTPTPTPAVLPTATTVSTESAAATESATLVVDTRSNNTETADTASQPPRPTLLVSSLPVSAPIVAAEVRTLDSQPATPPPNEPSPTALPPTAPPPATAPTNQQPMAEAQPAAASEPTAVPAAEPSPTPETPPTIESAPVESRPPHERPVDPPPAPSAEPSSADQPHPNPHADAEPINPPGNRPDRDNPPRRP